MQSHLGGAAVLTSEMTAPNQKTLPWTDASWSRRFSSAGSASSRAAMMPCTVSGSGSSPASSRSSSMRTYCSAYSGLPPARSRSTCCVSAGMTGLVLNPLMSCAVSASESGASESLVALRVLAGPSGAPLEQFRTRTAEDEDRHTACPVHHVFDEIKEVVIRPVQVVEDEHQRALLAQRFEEPAPGGERLVAPVAGGFAVAADAREWLQMSLHPLRIGGVGKGRCHDSEASSLPTPASRSRGCRHVLSPSPRVPRR